MLLPGEKGNELIVQKSLNKILAFWTTMMSDIHISSVKLANSVGKGWNFAKMAR